MDYTRYLVPLGTPGSILVSSLRPQGLQRIYNLDHVRKLGLPIIATRQKNTNVIYFQSGVVDTELHPEEDVWMVAVMPNTLVFDQQDNDESALSTQFLIESMPSTPPITLEQHRASLREYAPGFIYGVPLFPEIRIPVYMIPREDKRYVQVNPILDKHEYLNPWWMTLPEMAKNDKKTSEWEKFSYSKLVIWTCMGKWYLSEPTSRKYYAMTMKDKLRVASSERQNSYCIDKVLLKRLIADITFA